MALDKRRQFRFSENDLKKLKEIVKYENDRLKTISELYDVPYSELNDSEMVRKMIHAKYEEIQNKK